MKNSKEKNSKKYLNKVIGIIDKPYFREMENYGIRDINDQVYILSGVFGFDISIGGFGTTIYDSEDNKIYFESSVDYWWKREYDENGNSIYYQDSTGYLRKIDGGKWVMK